VVLADSVTDVTIVPLSALAWVVAHPANAYPLGAVQPDTVVGNVLLVKLASVAGLGVPEPRPQL
jgi:hypothetical protein